MPVEEVCDDEVDSAGLGPEPIPAERVISGERADSSYSERSTCDALCPQPGPRRQFQHPSAIERQRVEHRGNLVGLGEPTPGGLIATVVAAPGAVPPRFYLPARAR